MADHKYTDLIKLSTPVPRWHYKQWTEAREFVRGVAGHQSIWVGHPRLAIMVGITLAVSFAALPLTLPTLLWGPFSYSSVAVAVGAIAAVPAIIVLANVLQPLPSKVRLTLNSLRRTERRRSVTPDPLPWCRKIGCKSRLLIRPRRPHLHGDAGKSRRTLAFLLLVLWLRWIKR